MHDRVSVHCHAVNYYTSYSMRRGPDRTAHIIDRDRYPSRGFYDYLFSHAHRRRLHTAGPRLPAKFGGNQVCSSLAGVTECPQPSLEPLVLYKSFHLPLTCKGPWTSHQPVCLQCNVPPRWLPKSLSRSRLCWSSSPSLWLMSRHISTIMAIKHRRTVSTPAKLTSRTLPSSHHEQTSVQLQEMIRRPATVSSSLHLAGILLQELRLRQRSWKPTTT